MNHFTFGQGGDAVSRKTSRASASNAEEEPGNRIVGKARGSKTLWNAVTPREAGNTFFGMLS